MVGRGRHWTLFRYAGSRCELVAEGNSIKRSAELDLKVKLAKQVGKLLLGLELGVLVYPSLSGSAL